MQTYLRYRSNRPSFFPQPLANKGTNYAQFFFSKISAYNTQFGLC